MKRLAISVLLIISSAAYTYCQDIVTIEEDAVRFTIESKDVVQIKSSGLIGPAGPVGSIVIWPTEIVPEGYLVCDGREVLRSLYEDLFNVIGERFGAGDGSTTFNLPDLRGVFLRGWNEMRADEFSDPETDSRSRPAAPGATISGGNHVGTFQLDSFKRHHHRSESQGSCSITSSGSYRYPWGQSYGGNWFSDYSGGVETRPKNIAMMFVIKY
ncbi:MAG: tail fiber protein [Spirochaetes bacterium]|nr:tail fiber protein [Spirochaetota bacterium]